MKHKYILGQCIETAWPNDFESVFNKLNKPECISLRSTPKEVNVIPLTVKRACVRYKQVLSANSCTDWARLILIK